VIRWHGLSAFISFILAGVIVPASLTLRAGLSGQEDA